MAEDQAIAQIWLLVTFLVLLLVPLRNLHLGSRCSQQFSLFVEQSCREVAKKEKQILLLALLQQQEHVSMICACQEVLFNSHCPQWKSYLLFMIKCSVRSSLVFNVIYIQQSWLVTAAHPNINTVVLFLFIKFSSFVSKFCLSCEYVGSHFVMFFKTQLNFVILRTTCLQNIGFHVLAFSINHTSGTSLLNFS